MLRVVLDSLAETGDGVCENVAGDKGVRPDRPDDALLGRHFAGVSCRVDEHLQDLGLDGRLRALARGPIALRLDPERTDTDRPRWSFVKDAWDLSCYKDVVEDKRLHVETLERRLRPLFERPEVQLVILFGSRAGKRFRASSDLDLAILGDRVLDTVELTNFIMQSLHFSEVDVVDLRRCSPTLALMAAGRGRLLHEREPGRFAAFCSLALRRFEDARKLRDAQKDSIRNFLAQRGLDVAS